MALPQPLPPWLQPVTLTYLNTDQRTTGLVQLPIPYSGPSIPLAWPFSSIDHPGNLHSAPTQTINFYDGSGPFTVVAGTILTEPPSRPTPASPSPILPLATALLHTASPASLFVPTQVVISTVLVSLPPSQPSAVVPVAPSQQSGLKPVSFTALMACFLVLLVILVSIVLSLLMFIVRRRARRSIQLDSARTPYEFNSDLFPQNRHGSQTLPHHLNRLRQQQHDWVLGLDQAEKPPPRPVHQTYHDSRDTRRLSAWKNLQKSLRKEFQSFLQHFSTQSQPSPLDQSHHSPYPDHPHRFRNPNHDPSINTDTYQRVSRWFNALRTPASSFLRAPSSFKTLENQDDDHEPELVQPTTFKKTSLVSSVKAWVISSDSPSPGHANSPDQPLKKSPSAQSSQQKKLGGGAASTNPSSSRSSRKHDVPDHRPLLEAQEEEEQAGSPNLGQDAAPTERTDSPLEHLQHLTLSPLSTPIPARPSLSSPPPHPNTPPSLATNAKRVRVKKSGPENSIPSTSPRSVSYHSPAKILVLKRRSDLISKPFHSPGSIHAHADPDHLSSGENSPTLRFPLPHSGSASSGPFSAANQCVPVSLGALQPASDILTPDDDEIVYNAARGDASIQQLGPRRSSISNLGGVSELGVVEKPQCSSVGLAAGSIEDNEGSFLSEELFYVRPKLAKFKDGKWVPENLDNQQISQLLETGGDQQGSKAQEKVPEENRANSQSGPHQGTSTNKCLDFLRRSVSLPLSTTALLQVKSGPSPLDKLAQRSAGLIGPQEDSDSDSSDSSSSSPDEKSRLLSNQSRYSRATLGQRLEVTSLKGSFAGLSGGSGGTTSQNSNKLKGLSGGSGSGGGATTSPSSRQQRPQRVAELSGGNGNGGGTTTSQDSGQEQQQQKQ